jgi:hypothetical protein
VKSAQWTIGLVVVGALAVSCNALTGLSDYEKVDCVGSCGDAGTDVVPDVAFDVEAGKDVVADVADEDALEADVVEADVSDADVVTYDAIELGPVDPKLRWAQWPMPHWDPDSGDATVVKNDAGAFFDLVTKLVWSKSSEVKTLGQAEAECKTVGRLPTRIELVSLLEPGLASPHDPIMNDTEPGSYWTSSEVFDPNATQQFFWVVNFENGTLGQLNPSQEAYVRCIVK